MLSVTVVDRSWDRKKAFLIFPMLFCPGNVNEVQCSRTSSQLLVSYDTFKEIPLIVFFFNIDDVGKNKQSVNVRSDMAV